MSMPGYEHSNAEQEHVIPKTNFSIEAQHLKIYCLEKGIKHFSLNIVQHTHHFHQCILQSDHPFLKYGIQRLVIEVPQNFLDKRQEFIKLVE
jgi:hypothetical protein